MYCTPTNAGLSQVAAKKTSKILAVCVAALMFAALYMSCATILQHNSIAHAMTIESCTAAPNEDGGTRILGATPTRVTWRGQADADEQVSSISLAFPKDVEFDAKMAKVTVLTGLERLPITSEAEKKDKDELHINFDKPVPAGSSFLIQVYDVTFPGDGGSFTINAQVKDENGQWTKLPAPTDTIDITKVSIPERIASWLSHQDWVKAWNSNTFLHLFFDPTLIVTSIPRVFTGWLTALGIVVVAFPSAIPIGFILALMRMSKLRILRGIAGTFVNIVRGTPMFLQIYIAFFGLPLLGLNINNFALGCCVMAINSSAYLCEIFRAGIQSINVGQFEAARSLGMSGSQTMIHIIAPQAFRRVIPTMTNELILLYKDTSLLAAVGIMETVMYAKTITAATGNITPYIVAAGFYLIVTIPMSTITRRMEERGTSHKIAVKKKAPQANDPHNDGKTWSPDVNATRDSLAIKTADL